MKKMLAAAISGALGIFSAAAMALGLGNVVVESNLNEPLRAQIPLVTRSGEDISEVEVTLASAEDFERVGLDRSLLAIPLNFTLDTSGSQPVIRVTSSQSVRDPFLNFLIEVNWPRGRLLREYTLLLDPPVLAPSIAQESSAPVSTSSVPEAADERPAVVSESESVRQEPQSEEISGSDPTPATGEAARDFDGDTYGPVASGETLWEIADQTRTSDVTVQEMMLALLRANPEAFGDGNINYLKRGAVLRIPDAAGIGSMSRDEVIAQVQTQNELWDAYRQQVSGRVATVADSSSGSTFGSAQADSDDRGSRLELVAPSNDGMGASDATGSGTDSAEVRAELALAREELANSAAENAELNSRVEQLEGLVSELERMVSLKDDDLAALQERLSATNESLAAADPQTAAVAETDGAGDTDTAPTGFETTDDVAVNDPGDAFEFADEDAADEGNEIAAREAARNAETASADESSSTPAEPVAPARTVPTVRSRPEPTLMDRLMQWWFVPLGVLVLGLLGGLLFWRSRSQGQESEAATLSLDDDLDEFGADDAFEDVDDEPNEQYLLDEIAAQPDDPQRRLVLLRSYYAKGEADKFEEQARALRDYISGEGHPAWVETRSMGARLLPASALFAASVPADDGISETTPEAESNFPFDDEEAGDAATALDSDDDLNFDFDGPERDDALEPASDDLSLDLDGDDELSLDLDDDLESESGSPASFDLDDERDAATVTAADDDSDLSLDLDGDDDFDAATADLGSDEGFDAATADLGSDEGFDAATADLDGDEDFDAAAADLGIDEDDLPSLELDDDELPSLEFESESESEPATAADTDTTELSLDMDSDDASLDLDDDLDLGDIDFEPESETESVELDDMPAATAAPAEPVFDPDATTELPAIDLDDDELFEGEDTVGTKLDLAKAYIDMGDPDGARGMLEEVVAEGSDQQRDEAERLIEALD